MSRIEHFVEAGLVFDAEHVSPTTVEVRPCTCFEQIGDARVVHTSLTTAEFRFETELEQETIVETHTDEDWENDARLVDTYKIPPRDCSACHTGKTRPCHCGGRIHNEMHGSTFVEQCFSCGRGWTPA